MTNLAMPNLADMIEAQRLTEAGRLQEASALIQRSLSGSPSTDASTHPAMIPARLRAMLDQALRGLRGDVSGRGEDRSDPSALREGDGSFVEHTYTGTAGSRRYKLFVPSSIKGKRPLVVMLHGCTQSPDDFAAGTRMNQLAEEEGFYVAYPRQTRGANPQKCWNWFQPADQVRESGEAAIIVGIVREILTTHSVDPSRVFVAGLSAGGAAAVNIARAYPDVFAAVGVHSGLAACCAKDLSSALLAMKAGAPGGQGPGPVKDFGGGTSKGPLMPTIVFHGDGDGTVHSRNAEEILIQAGRDRLRAQREEGRSRNGSGYTRTRYQDGSDRTQLESWLLKGGGHAWSGGSQEGSYTDPNGPDASRAMLDFFLAHKLGG